MSSCLWMSSVTLHCFEICRHNGKKAHINDIIIKDWYIEILLLYAICFKKPHSFNISSKDIKTKKNNKLNSICYPRIINSYISIVILSAVILLINYCLRYYYVKDIICKDIYFYSYIYKINVFRRYYVNSYYLRDLCHFEFIFKNLSAPLL